MYSVNGIPLDNATLGWRLMRPTKPLLNLVMERSNVPTPGRHGTLAGMPASLAPPVLTFVVQTPKAGVEALEALWLHGTVLTYTGVAGRVAEFEFLSMTHTIYGPAMESVRIEATIRLAGVFWRDADPSITALVPLASASVNVDAWPGTSGIIPDAVLRFRGPFTGLMVRSGVSWFNLPGDVPGGSYFRFHTDAGLGFVTTTDTWNGGTEVSGVVEFDGPDGYFQMIPSFTDPAVRAARVEVTTTARAAGAAAQIYGRGAYLA